MSQALVVCTPEELRALVREAVREERASTPAGPPEVLTLSGVSELLGKDRKTIMRFVRDEGMPAHPIGDREFRFFRSEVLAWLAARPAKREGNS